jgi:Protein of unknown function (DUF3306)
MSEDFFSRWSRRKQGLDTGETPQAKPTAPTRPTAPPLPGASTGDAQAPAPAKPLAQLDPSRTGAGGGAGQPPAGAAHAPSPAAPTASPADNPTPLPTMADVQDLTPASDFQTFMRQGVPGEVRNAAMKKLFTDPHFNVMDGLDIYIGDYTQPDPLPAGMLEKMVGAELLNLFPAKVQGVGPQGTAAGAQENPVPSPDAPQGVPLVAQSPQPPTTPTLQTIPALQAPVPPLASPKHDHPDLQLQPNHAPASPDPGQRTG